MLKIILITYLLFCVSLTIIAIYKMECDVKKKSRGRKKKLGLKEVSILAVINFLLFGIMLIPGINIAAILSMFKEE